jgi:transposase-like protein
MITCPYCQSQQRQVKNGKNPAGSQRWKCQWCGRKYTPEPIEHGYPDALRQQAVKMSVDGINYRRIGRFLGVDHKSVMNWVKAHIDQLPPAPVPADLNNAEMDELFTFVGKKKTSST